MVYPDAVEPTFHPDDRRRDMRTVRDRLARPEHLWPSVVTVHPTNRCDHRCGWCWFQRDGTCIDMQECIRALEVLIGMGAREIVVSGGGEPLLHPDIRELLAFLGSVPTVTRRLYTNGSQLAALPELREAFDYVRVSMDAGEAQLYSVLHGTGATAYGATLAALGELGQSAAAPLVGVSMIVTDANMHTCTSLIADCRRLGIPFVFLKPMMDTLTHRSLPAVHIADADQVQVHVREGRRPDSQTLLPMPMSVAAMAIALTADGGLYACCHLCGEEHRLCHCGDRRLSAAIGALRHRRALEHYRSLQHPCRAHDAWQVWTDTGGNSEAENTLTTELAPTVVVE
ncbi:radical SAM protein [bacterium]|nr:radical SAM protein [bacterium]